MDFFPFFPVLLYGYSNNFVNTFQTQMIWNLLIEQIIAYNWMKNVMVTNGFINLYLDFLKTRSLGLAFWWEKRICKEHNFCIIIVLWKSFIDYGETPKCVFENRLFIYLLFFLMRKIIFRLWWWGIFMHNWIYFFQYGYMT